MCWNARGARVTCESLQPFILRTLPRKSWTASACLRVHHPLTRLCNPLKRTGSEDGKRPKPDSCAWVVNLAYPERSFVVILPSWLPPAQHNTATATFRSCVLPVPVLRSPLILLIRQVFADRIARQLRPPADLSNRYALSYMPASDHTQYRHVYHSFALLLG